MLYIVRECHTWVVLCRHGPLWVNSPLQLFRLADELLRGSIQISVLHSTQQGLSGVCRNDEETFRQARREGGGGEAKREHSCDACGPGLSTTKAVGQDAGADDLFGVQNE